MSNMLFKTNRSLFVCNYNFSTKTILETPLVAMMMFLIRHVQLGGLFPSGQNQEDAIECVGNEFDLDQK